MSERLHDAHFLLRKLEECAMIIALVKLTYNSDRMALRARMKDLAEAMFPVWHNDQYPVAPVGLHEDQREHEGNSRREVGELSNGATHGVHIERDGDVLVPVLSSDFV